jgi:hypothetical protein
MHSQNPRTGRAAHLLLLGALLLYIGSVALEPLVHIAAVAAPGNAGTEAVLSGDEDAAPEPAVDHECAVCKLTRTFSPGVAPVAAAVLEIAAGDGSAAPTIHVRAPPVFTSLQPRAPPHA